MTAAEVLHRHDQLVDMTVRLTGEFPEFPAGSVMRCVARVVRRERRRGVPENLLPGLSEVAARRVLSRRLSGPARAC